MGDPSQSSGVVERYLACLGSQDWDGLATTVADRGLVRDGPFCDMVEGKEAYLGFLRGVFSGLHGYQLHVHRISHASERLSFVELTETFDINGVPTEYPECLVFEQDGDGLISYVSVFIKRPGGEPRVEGGRAGQRQRGTA
ncbi:nuclear transport factor 2 family protein [Mycobacterium xenopi]|uniref:nuclear transport factor 2 family protein n=1 Tax=Mycobacterium xenopi TaxID=1789 RepID=UPI0002EF028C|nr:nuclear transport factor 2 family protein [Mycobacterium xenopi]